MKLEPQPARIIVKRGKREEKVGSLYIPSDEGVSHMGKVMAIGSECDWIEEGDDILFAQYSGTAREMSDISLGDDETWKDCLVMNEEDVLCKIKGDK